MRRLPRVDDRQANYVIPPAGANAWAEPDPDAARLPRLGPGEPVEILETRGVWVRVHTAAGREAWIDGRRLQPDEPTEPDAQTPTTAPPLADADRAIVPPPTPVRRTPGPVPAPAATTASTADVGDWAPTHTMPAAGGNAWVEPDPDATAAPRLDPDEPIEVIEILGVWAKVRAESSRQVWVDGRRLQPLERVQPTMAVPPSDPPAPIATTGRDAGLAGGPTSGSRRRWLVVGVSVAVLAAAVGVSVSVFLGGCGPDSGAPALARVTDEVLMHGADPGNTNDFGDNLAPSGPELSQYWCSQGENRFNAVSISGGSVYANDEDRERVVELDLRTGEVISSYPGVEGDTALGDTMLYVALFDVTGLDRTSGAEAWAFTEPAVIFDPPVLAGDLVLVVESPGESDTLYALDASTGVPRWSQPGLDRGVLSTVGVDAGVVVFPEREGILTFDLATGNPGPFYRGSVALGVVVVAGVILFDSAEDGLTALNLETASLRWESGQRAEPAVAVDEGVALGVGWGDDSKLGMYAYDLTSGTPIWRYSTGRQDRDALSRPTVAGGVAYFSIDSTIYAIEVATGELVWSADVGVNVWSDIIIANGLLMFGGEDGKLHAFGDR